MKTTKGRNVVVVGTQWGDEGKGKIVDLLAAEHDAVARFNGGANAGHTIVAHGKKFATHLLPSGILTASCMNVLGNGNATDVTGNVTSTPATTTKPAAAAAGTSQS